MLNPDSISHVRGESVYVDDVPLRTGTLFGVPYGSSHAHGKITHLDLSQAIQVEGVVTILTSKDIPGNNQIGNIIKDEPLFAEDKVHFQGQPVALVVAKTELIAREAITRIKMKVEPLPVVTDPREAHRNGDLIIPSRTFEMGDTENIWEECEHIFQGSAESGGQEQLYIETQGAYALPQEGGSITLISSTQGPTVVQRAAAMVLGLPMHKIEVEVRRLGGGFGGKEDQATAWGVMAALAAQRLQKPVKVILHRLDDLRMTGKRHPYSSDFKIGLSHDLKILGYQVEFFQNAGASADLSPAVMERTLFHATNSYYIPNVKATAHCCRTNLPPNTAFRGFGGPQGMFVIESAIANAAEKLGVRAAEIQKKNLLNENDEFSYGQLAQGCEAGPTWNKAVQLFDWEKQQTQVEKFNQENKILKKGLAMMPICFGISFTKTHMNQARALVHVYTDGSVGVSTGAVEMGQGVNAKLLQVAAGCFTLPLERIKIETTNTTRIANTSPSAASATADLNGKAVQLACEQILHRLKEVAAGQVKGKVSEIEIKEGKIWKSGNSTQLTWETLIMEAHLQRVNLSEHAHYATPDINFDPTREKGNPFAYHVYGTAMIQTTLDVVRGTYQFDSVKVVHDSGKSLNPMVDLGQTEGGIVQGLGWMTMEDIVYNPDGKLLSNSLSTYKIPDIYSAPSEMTVEFHQGPEEKLAIMGSKAVGEPPLMYGIGGYFAIRDAMRAHNQEDDIPYSAPITPEKVLMGLYQKTLVPNYPDK